MVVRFGVAKSKILAEAKCYILLQFPAKIELKSDCTRAVLDRHFDMNKFVIFLLFMYIFLIYFFEGGRGSSG